MRRPVSITVEKANDWTIDDVYSDLSDWPTDHRDVLALVLEEIEDRLAVLWGE